MVTKALNVIHVDRSGCCSYSSEVFLNFFLSQTKAFFSTHKRTEENQMFFYSPTT